MNTGLNIVYKSVKDWFADSLECYYDKNQIVSEESQFTVVEISTGTSIDYGDYLELKIESDDGIGIILSDRGIVLTNKYTVTINNTYTNLSIVDHLTDGTYDIIRLTSYPDLIEEGGLDQASSVSFKLVNSIYLESEPIDINMRPPYMSIFGGERVVLSINSKYDKTRSRVDSYENILMSRIMNNYRKFDIYDEALNKIGYYKLIALPRIQSNFDNGDDIQRSQVVLDGYYLVKYN